jgi:hypothetical protein
MATATGGPSGDAATSLSDRARDIFDDLGYTVSGDGPAFDAVRGWKAVRVEAVERAPPETGGEGDPRCFVTRDPETDDVARSVAAEDPGYDWAVIGVTEDGYEVVDRS